MPYGSFPGFAPQEGVGSKVPLLVLLGLWLLALMVVVLWLCRPPQLPALVRVDLDRPDDLLQISALGMPLEGRVETPDAAYLLMVILPQEQRRLEALGLNCTVLDPDARGAVYYLLEVGNLPAITGPEAPFTILQADGYRAVARLRTGAIPVTSEKIAHLESDGLVPLAAVPVSSVPPSTQGVIQPDPLDP